MDKSYLLGFLETQMDKAKVSALPGKKLSGSLFLHFLTPLFFARRMESKEKCEQIISMFNSQQLQGSKEPLLVKFADGGNKKRNAMYKSPDQRMWAKEMGEVSICSLFPTKQTISISQSHTSETLKNKVADEYIWIKCQRL